MTFTKQQKVLAGILGLGVLAFGVDRFMLGGTTEPANVGASAYGVSPGSGGRLAGGVVTPELTLPTPNEQSIARRLARYAEATSLDPHGVREAFVPSEAWVPRMAPKAETRAPKVREDPRETFVAAHRLNGVAGSGQAAIAIVNGVPVRMGQAVDGCTLVEVTERSAVFTSPAGRVELRLRQ